jgi:tetratricopeptide (TPR) repeat protein
LAALVENNLIVREGGATGEPRFRMLETIREFALERLAASDEEGTIRRRHAAYFLALAEREAPPDLGPGQPGQVARLADDLDNLRAALDWSVAHVPANALRLAAALGWFWQARGYAREGRTWLERALEGDAHVDPSVRARALYWSGAHALYLGDYRAATTRLRATTEIQRRLGDGAGLAQTLIILGAVAEYQGDDATATARYEESLALARRFGDHRLVGHLLSNLADAAFRAGDPARALALDEESLAALRAVEDLWGVVRGRPGGVRARRPAAHAGVVAGGRRAGRRT